MRAQEDHRLVGAGIAGDVGDVDARLAEIGTSIRWEQYLTLLDRADRALERDRADKAFELVGEAIRVRNEDAEVPADAARETDLLNQAKAADSARRRARIREAPDPVGVEKAASLVSNSPWVLYVLAAIVVFLVIAGLMSL